MGTCVKALAWDAKGREESGKPVGFLCWNILVSKALNLVSFSTFLEAQAGGDRTGQSRLSLGRHWTAPHKPWSSVDALSVLFYLYFVASCLPSPLSPGLLSFLIGKLDLCPCYEFWGANPFPLIDCLILEWLALLGTYYFKPLWSEEMVI